MKQFKVTYYLTYFLPQLYHMYVSDCILNNICLRTAKLISKKELKKVFLNSWGEFKNNLVFAAKYDYS